MNKFGFEYESKRMKLDCFIEKISTEDLKNKFFKFEVNPEGI